MTVTINSDDPPMFNTTLTREFEVLVEHYDYDLVDLVNFTRNAIQGAFLPNDQKRSLEGLLDAEVVALANELSIDALSSSGAPPSNKR